MRMSPTHIKDTHAQGMTIHLGKRLELFFQLFQKKNHPYVRDALKIIIIILKLKTVVAFIIETERLLTRISINIDNY